MIYVRSESSCFCMLLFHHWASVVPGVTVADEEALVINLSSCLDVVAFRL